MYLFVRRGRLAGGQTRASMMWATEITERVNQVTGLGVSLHMQMFSADVGELVWATMVPDLATLETGFEKLQVDDFFIAEQDRAHGFMEGPPTDVLEQVIHGDPVDLGPGSYTFAGTAVCAPGRTADAIAVAIELADRAQAITGAPTTIATAMTGAPGGITWASSYPGIESLEAGQRAMADDPDWIAMLDAKTGDVFTPDAPSAMQAIYRRVM